MGLETVVGLGLEPQWRAGELHARSLPLITFASAICTRAPPYQTGTTANASTRTTTRTAARRGKVEAAAARRPSGGAEACCCTFVSLLIQSCALFVRKTATSSKDSEWSRKEVRRWGLLFAALGDWQHHLETLLFLPSEFIPGTHYCAK